MKVKAILLLVLLFSSFLHGNDRDLRTIAAQHLLEQLDPADYPYIAIVREVDFHEKSFRKFQQHELKWIFENSGFAREQLIPVSSIQFPTEEKRRFHDSQVGSELVVVYLTRIEHRPEGVAVGYMIDSGFRNSGWNYPEDGSYKTGSILMKFVNGERHFEFGEFPGY